jgi:hypothetical protein
MKYSTVHGEVNSPVRDILPGGRDIYPTGREIYRVGREFRETGIPWDGNGMRDNNM